MARLLKCASCGRLEHEDLIDIKPQPGEDPVTSDWDRYECIVCYGPDWLPAVEMDLRLNKEPSLRSHYWSYIARTEGRGL